MLVSTHLPCADCEKVKWTARSSGTSFSMLLHSEDTCGGQKLSSGAIGGIVAGSVVGVTAVVVLGVLALKKGYARDLFKSEERKEAFVV